MKLKRLCKVLIPLNNILYVYAHHLCKPLMGQCNLYLVQRTNLYGTGSEGDYACMNTMFRDIMNDRNNVTLVVFLSNFIVAFTSQVNC